MARAYTKCSNCNDVIWFRDTDKPPQAVQCTCGKTKLTETGEEGNYKSPTIEEINKLT